GNYGVWLGRKNAEGPGLEFIADANRVLTVVASRPVVLAIEIDPPATDSPRGLTITVLPG
ncbi:MAG: hypothetical protein FWE61_04375, partial [Micrococcales bacterium]|nr:hypothetical protein [Micrococcales bacterium]